MHNSKISLYNRDFYLWAIKQILVLKTQQLNMLDSDNLIHVMEEIVRSDRIKIKVYTLNLIKHIFKISYCKKELVWSKKKCKKEIEIYRKQIKKIIDKSPSLKKYLDKNYQQWYEEALTDFEDKFNIAISQKFSLHKILEENFRDTY